MSLTTSNSTPQTEPLVSVLVCTRNRKDNIVPTVRAFQKSDYTNFELLIVDQSDDDSTINALRPITETDLRVRCYKRETPGVSGSLNFARKEAKSRYLVLTDDDCEPEAGFIRAMFEAFEANPQVGCVYGNVLAAPCDSTKGYIPVCLFDKPQTLTRVSDFLKTPANMSNFGIGAAMAVRADAVEAAGGWDACIGPGSKFGSGVDHDVTISILAAGYHVYLCPQARVVHYGLRQWEHWGRDTYRWGFGAGATFAKYLRCGVVYNGSLRMFLYNSGSGLARVVRRQRPYNLAYPQGWIKGFSAGLKHPVDKKLRSFQPVEARESRQYGEQVAQVVLRTDQLPAHAVVQDTREEAPRKAANR